MGRYIVRLPGTEPPLYIEWSTIVDAPVTDALTLDELRADMRDDAIAEAAERFDREFPVRIRRADEYGCSALERMSAEDCMSANRAGPGESDMPVDDLIAELVRQRLGDRA